MLISYKYERNGLKKALCGCSAEHFGDQSILKPNAKASNVCKEIDHLLAGDYDILSGSHNKAFSVDRKEWGRQIPHVVWHTIYALSVRTFKLAENNTIREWKSIEWHTNSSLQTLMYTSTVWNPVKILWLSFSSPDRYVKRCDWLRFRFPLQT